MSLTENFESFVSWEGLLDHVSAGYELFYQAPMDYRPARVSAVIRKDGKLRVMPHWSSDADPFTADVDHLSRFKRLDRRF
jgi:hypothetical protein